MPFIARFSDINCINLGAIVVVVVVVVVRKICSDLSLFLCHDFEDGIYLTDLMDAICGLPRDAWGKCY